MLICFARLNRAPQVCINVFFIAGAIRPHFLTWQEQARGFGKAEIYALKGVMRREPLTSYQLFSLLTLPKIINLSHSLKRVGDGPRPWRARVNFVSNV